MARLANLDQYLDPRLILALPGPDEVERDYAIPLPDSVLGLWCRRIAETAGEVNSASTDEELREAAARAEELPSLPGDLSFEEQLLGSAYAQMLADRVPDPYVQFAAKVVYVWIITGEEGAERFWKAGGRPPAPGPGNRAERRAATRTNSTAPAAGIPRQGSSSGTTSRGRSGGSGRRRRSRGSRS